MYQSVNFNDFLNAFASHGRENQFSYEAKKIIFDYIEDYERDSGENTEMDVIALCCELSEMDLPELLKYFDITEEVLTADNEAELLGEATDYLEQNTYLLGLTPQNTFVFQNF